MRSFWPLIPVFTNFSFSLHLRLHLDKLEIAATNFQHGPKSWLIWSFFSEVILKHATMSVNTLLCKILLNRSGITSSIISFYKCFWASHLMPSVQLNTYKQLWYKEYNAHFCSKIIIEFMVSTLSAIHPDHHFWTRVLWVLRGQPQFIQNIYMSVINCLR